MKILWHTLNILQVQSKDVSRWASKWSERLRACFVDFSLKSPEVTKRLTFLAKCVKLTPSEVVAICLQSLPRGWAWPKEARKLQGWTPCCQFSAHKRPWNSSWKLHGSRLLACWSTCRNSGLTYKNIYSPYLEMSFPGKEQEWGLISFSMRKFHSPRL